MQVQADVGVLVAELLDHLGQHVAGLRVRGRDRERAARLVLELLGQVLDVADLAQDADRAVDHLLPGRRDPREVAPVAHEDLEAELVLEQLDLLADARLRGVQLLRRGGDVETGLGDGREIAELMQFHPRILATGEARPGCAARAGRRTDRLLRSAAGALRGIRRPAARRVTCARRAARSGPHTSD